MSGFRTLAETTLTLGPVTALVGEANAGKSNILSAVALVGGAGQPGLAPEDVAPGHGVINIDASTSTGPVAVRYADGTVTRHGRRPVAMLPSALRSSSIVAPVGPEVRDADVAVLAEVIRAQAAHDDSPGARAEDLLPALERCCELGVTGVLLLVEEPELYLRPQAQRYLYRLLHQFAAGGNQVMYSTHAPAFLNVGRVEELAVVARGRGTGTTVHQSDPLAARDGFRAMSEFDAERSELFLADVAILVEGRTEKLALPHVFRLLGVDVDRAGISVVECGGKANLPVFVGLCQATGVPFLVVHDRDAAAGRPPIPSEHRINELLRSLAGADRVVELAPDFEAVVGLRGHRHKPEQAWQHFRSADGAEVPAELRRLVELASEARRQASVVGRNTVP